MNAPLLIVTSDQHKVSCVRPDIHKIKVFILGIKGVRILFVFFAEAPGLPCQSIFVRNWPDLCVSDLILGEGVIASIKTLILPHLHPAGQIVEYKI